MSAPTTPEAVLRSRDRAYACHLWIALVALCVALLVFAASGDAPSGAAGSFLLLYWLGLPTLFAAVVAVRETGRAADGRLRALLVAAVAMIASWIFGATVGAFELAYATVAAYFSWKWFRTERPALRAHLSGAASRTTLTVLLLLSASLTGAQPPDSRPSAAALFEETLAAEGLEAALAGLSEALSDTSAYAIDGHELAIGLPARLVVRHRRTEALELIKALAPLYGDDARYQEELGKAHLRCGDAPAARRELARALDAASDRPELAWMVEHVEELAAVARLQAEREDRLVPGASTGLDGPYLGQAPPGRVPEVFAPGILSTTAHEYHISFSPDGREIVFSRSRVGSLVSRWVDGGWTAPEVIHFLDEDHLTEEANLTPDGRAVVFCGRTTARERRVLYRAERIGDAWGRATELFPGMYGTSTLDGSLYYTARGEGKDYGAIVKRRWTGSGYGEPQVVPGEGINSESPDAHPWISPAEDLLLFDSYRKPGAGIYVSFRRSDGSWSSAVPLHDRLGIPPVGQCALSHDGRYLFFCLAGDMYWVDAGFLAELSPDGASRG